MELDGKTPAYLVKIRGKKKWRGTESNRRRRDFQSLALPTELPRHHIEEPRFEAGTSIFSHGSKVNNLKAL